MLISFCISKNRFRFYDVLPCFLKTKRTYHKDDHNRNSLDNRAWVYFDIDDDISFVQAYGVDSEFFVNPYVCTCVCVVVHNEIYIAHAVPKIGDVTKSRMGLLTSMSSVLWEQIRPTSSLIFHSDSSGTKKESFLDVWSHGSLPLPRDLRNPSRSYAHREEAVKRKKGIFLRSLLFGTAWV